MLGHVGHGGSAMSARLPMYVTPVYVAVKFQRPLKDTGLSWPTIFEHLMLLVQRDVFTLEQVADALWRELGKQ